MLTVLFSCRHGNEKENCGCKDADIPSTRTAVSAFNITVKNGIVFLNEQPYCGYIYQLYPNSKDTFALTGYWQGLQSGVTKKWFDNHQLMEIRFYCKGQKEGPQLAFWENGLKRFAFTAHEDGNEGSLEEWNREGHLFHLGHYLHGQEEGAQQLWYDNGKIRANYVIRQGKRYGLLGTKNCKNVSDSIFVVK